MANKQESKKRRVAAARQQEIRMAAAAKRERRKRLWVGAVVGFLALALIAPLTAGLILNSSDNDAVSTTTTTLPELPWLPPAQAGAVLAGATPCPATDGTAERTTGFETAPPMCIDEQSIHELTFTTADDEFSVPVDASLDAQAANLAVTFARYRTYEGTTVNRFAEDGLLWIGGVGGDTGFTIPSSFVPGGADPYPVGSVVLVSETGTGRVDGKIAVVLDEAGGALLALEPRHVVVGMVDDVEALRAVADAAITAVTATETG